MLSSVCSCFTCGGDKYETHYAEAKSPTPPPKKVTFDNMVLQHHCLVENRAKPYFHINRGGDKEPPDYKEFLEMKKWRMQLLDEKDNLSDASSPPTTIFASTPRQSLETPSKKPFFTEKDITEVLSVLNAHAEKSKEETLKMEKTENHNLVVINKGKGNLEESSLSFNGANPQQYPNLSASALDEGYSTSSQNGWPIDGNPSLSPPPSVSKTFDDAYDTSSKSGTMSEKEQEDLQNFLRTFEGTSSSDEIDEEEGSMEDTSWKPESNLMKENSLNLSTMLPKSSFIPELPEDHSVECHRIETLTEDLSVDIKNAVNELLSVGSKNEKSLLNEQAAELDELGDSYENLLENLSIFAQTGRFEVLVESSDFSAVSSLSEVSEGEENLFETNDSGIDESMPGVTKDDSSVDPTGENVKSKRPEDRDLHKSKDGGHRKHKKHRSKDASLHRSKSDARRASENLENGDENAKSGTLPHPKKNEENGEARDELTESVTVSNDEPKKLRHRKDQDGDEHHKRRSRSRDRKSEGDEEGGDGSEHRKRNSRSRERKSEANGETNDGKDEKDGSEHRKRSSRSRERKAEENGETNDDSEHRKRKSRSRERKLEANDDANEENGEQRKRKGRSRDRHAETNGDVKDENENGEQRKRRSRSRDKISEVDNQRSVNGDVKAEQENGENHKSREKRPKSSSTNTTSEETVTHLTNGEGTLHRSDHKKERRSEPTTSEKSEGSKHKSRASEPGVVRSSSNAKRRDANPKSKRPVLAATVVKAALIEGPKEVIIKTQDGLKTQDGAVVQRHPTTHIDSSSEYMYETPDGKHCVYLRPKEDEQENKSNEVKKETKTKPDKKETKFEKQFDQHSIKIQNTSIADYGKRVHGDRKPIDDSLSDKYGISPDIISLLREEEKFWQKQQELKEWRVEQPRSREASNASEVDRRKWRAPPPKSDIEMEEDRLGREAKRLERLRVHQENLIKTFQDNLIRQELNPVSGNNDHLPYQTPYPKPPKPTVSRTSFPPTDADRQHGPAHYDLNNTDVGHGILHQDPKTMAKNYNNEKRTDRNFVKHHEDVEPDAHKTNGILHTNTSHDNISPSSPKDRAVCFSDDDEVFHESRRKGPRKEKTDYRGYFSDPDMLSDNSTPRTYLARPLLRESRTNIRCTACCKPISDERLMHVEGQNYYWHLKCFFCIVCNAFLNDRHTIRVRITNYKLHCRFCYSSQTGEQLSEV